MKYKACYNCSFNLTTVRREEKKEDKIDRADCSFVDSGIVVMIVNRRCVSSSTLREIIVECAIGFSLWSTLWWRMITLEVINLWYAISFVMVYDVMKDPNPWDDECLTCHRGLLIVHNVNEASWALGRSMFDVPLDFVMIHNVTSISTPRAINVWCVIRNMWWSVKGWE